MRLRRPLIWKVQTITWIIFQQVPQKVYQTISDKHAATAGAKIIVPNPRNTPAKYTKWQVDQLFKKKIKARLDFLLSHSHSIEDFLNKAKVLKLEVDFSGKYATYRLLDHSQLKNTRDRSLSKQDPNHTVWIRFRVDWQKMILSTHKMNLNPFIRKLPKTCLMIMIMKLSLRHGRFSLKLRTAIMSMWTLAWRIKNKSLFKGSMWTNIWMEPILCSSSEQTISQFLVKQVQLKTDLSLVQP